MRFQVPQFIEIEDKIFGPLTFKQFVYLAGGGGVCVIFWTFLPSFLAILISLPVAVLALALAFYKVNDKPFAYVVESFLGYTLGNKLYVWRKTPVSTKSEARSSKDAGQIQQIQVPKLSESKLKELTWSLDIKENQNPVTENKDNEL